MRSILEKALVALLNEEKDKADALFHDFILKRSRQIHESLRQGEDFVLNESIDDEFSIDEMFSEEDLSDEGDGEVDEAAKDPVDSEVTDSDEAETADTEETTDGEETTDIDSDEIIDSDEGQSEDGGESTEEETIEDRVADLEAELQRLTAEFDDAFGDGDDKEAAFSDDEEGHGADVTGGDDSEEALTDESAKVDSSDFDNLEEGVIDSLEKVSAPGNTEGLFAQGGKAQVNTKSPVIGKSTAQRQGGAPVKIDAEEHAGYERQESPKVGSMKKRTNTLDKASTSRSEVSKEGDKSALLNTNKEDKSAQHSLFDKKHK